MTPYKQLDSGVTVWVITVHKGYQDHSYHHHWTILAVTDLHHLQLVEMATTQLRVLLRENGCGCLKQGPAILGWMRHKDAECSCAPLRMPVDLCSWNTGQKLQCCDGCFQTSIRRLVPHDRNTRRPWNGEKYRIGILLFYKEQGRNRQKDSKSGVIFFSPKSNLSGSDVSEQIKTSTFRLLDVSAFAGIISTLKVDFSSVGKHFQCATYSFALTQQGSKWLAQM